MDIRLALDEILPKIQKPARYAGGEFGSVVKDPKKVKLRFAFCFPDLYEIGMSHLGMKILYSLFNRREEIWCERVFAPDVDMERMMREKGIPLYGLESKDPIGCFDFIGFTLQYELCYTAVLNMLDLAGVPVLAKDRGEDAPIVVAGGPCVCNPEPLADFIDIFFPGEGEEVDLEVMDLYMKIKAEGAGRLDKKRFLREASQIPGVYVPSLYEVRYNEDQTIQEVIPQEGAPAKVTKRIIQDLDKVFYPDQFVVPFVDVVHDRAVVEVMRGCIRGCRFCQAGFIYRPLREKSHETLDKNVRDLCDSTGYEEVSLSSLSTSDYTELEPLLDQLLSWTQDDNINLSLPSLRVDNFSEELLQKIAKVRKSGLTFAPEAGTQRMRDVINKNVSEQELMDTCTIAFAGGYTSVKLYFMLGLPTETMEDIKGIADLAQRVVDLFYNLPTKPKGKGVTVNIGLANFVPKPFTPFEFEPQATLEQLKERQKYLLSCIKTKKITVSFHDYQTSMLEGVLARGDRRLGKVIHTAWQKGCNLDGWDEHFHFDRWMESMTECGLDPAFYCSRTRSYDEIMPWDHMDYCISKSFLVRENKKAHENCTTPHCRLQCSGCGANKLVGGKCFGR